MIPLPQESTIDNPSQTAVVKKWNSLISAAEKRCEKDFKRMKDDMAFASSIQWHGQNTMDDDRYIVNVVHRLIAQKVASIYAKNPTVAVEIRKRLNFEIWDEQFESLIANVQQASEIQEQGMPLPPELAAFLADVDQGKTRQRLVKQVGKTLEIAYTYQVDSQSIDFKEQMKAAVRRTEITGVSFAKVTFCRSGSQYKDVSSVDAKSTLQDRANRVQGLMRKISDDGLGEGSAEFEELQVALASVQENQDDSPLLEERLEFDFPMSTSIIVDPSCRNLKGFVAAEWIAHKFVLPLDIVNNIFKTNVTVGSSGGATIVGETKTSDNAQESKEGSRVCLYQVFDYTNKTEFWIVDGWNEFVSPPTSPIANVTGFWPIFALTFNDVEIEPDENNSIYPPSTVQLAKSAQKEWNRSRQALREQRNANAPKYLVRKGFLTDADKAKLRDCSPNEVIELEGVPMDQPIEKFIVPFIHAPIDPSVYDTSPLEKDLLLATGMQQANLGPAQPNVTATVGNIAENSRLDVVGSNIDDLDSFLSRIAQCGGEMMLQQMSQEIIKRIVGPGAAWPMEESERADFLNEILLQVKAASSGRPNKSMDISNWGQIAPILQGAGANPIFMVEESIRRLDDKLDIQDAFPLQLPQGQPNSTDSQGENPQQEKSSAPNAKDQKNEQVGPPAPNPQNEQPPSVGN